MPATNTESFLQQTIKANQKINRDIERAFISGIRYPRARYFVRDSSMMFGIPKKYTGEGFSWQGILVAEAPYGEDGGNSKLKKIAKRLNAAMRSTVK